MSGATAGLALGAVLYAAAARRLPRPKPPARHDGPLLAAASVSAAAEELLWRGALLRILRRRRQRLALVATSCGFALAHLPGTGRGALATLAGLGGALGVVAERRGLVAAAVAHATYDVLVLLEEPPP